MAQTRLGRQLALLPLWQKKGVINFLLATYKGITRLYAVNYQINHMKNQISNSFSLGHSLPLFAGSRLPSWALAGARSEAG